MVYKHIMDNDYVIRDEKFYTWFMASENKRLGNTKPIMTTKSEHRTFASCNNTMSSPELKARLKYLVDDLNDKMNEIIFVKDSQRLFTNAQRYQMWVNQNGFCSETGKEILNQKSTMIQSGRQIISFLLVKVVRLQLRTDS